MRLKKRKERTNGALKNALWKRKGRTLIGNEAEQQSETHNLSKTNNYLLDTDIKLEAKMDLIIIHNSFEISISLSPPSPADLPRSRPTNDSSSNCMTGHPSRPPQSKLAHAR